MNKAKVCTVIRKLAIEAGREIMEIYDNNNIEVKFKNDESPVTHADEVADRLIFLVYVKHFPTYQL